MNDDTNSTLLVRAKGGDRDALGNLLNRYRPYLRILALRYLDSGVRQRVDPSDVIQQTCLDIHRDIDGFRGDHEAEWIGWVRRILENNVNQVIRRHIQAQKRSVRKEAVVDKSSGTHRVYNAGPVSKESSPSHRVMKGERAVRLAIMLGKLPEVQREAIRLRYLEGRTLQQIAESIGRSEMAVAGLLKRGLRSLRDLSGTESSF
ncbi:MAG: sigma-70 family RNA polymerase sigma factor [Pirellulaceae bacterium]|jgi:RNA polymerase sigma-70 factor, ECF subfamily|nr:sigma-70 family RNA polymerase sigma factor [Planctomycetaceae bacterium]